MTGTLSQGAHPGSYNGQDAYNNMLVTENAFYNSETRLSHESAVGYGICADSNGLQRSTYNFEGGQEEELDSEKGGDDMTALVRRLTPL